MGMLEEQGSPNLFLPLVVEPLPRSRPTHFQKKGRSPKYNSKVAVLAFLRSWCLHTATQAQNRPSPYSEELGIGAGVLYSSGSRSQKP